MKLLLKNYLLQNKIKSKIALFFLLFFCENGFSQNVNCISNGSFEEVITDTSTPNFYSAKFWGATDSSKFYGELLSKNTIPIKVPLSSYTYQLPRHGNNHLIGLQYCTTCPNNKRGYPRNRLRQVLKANSSYCFTMYVNLSNQSTHGIDAIGAYFGNSSIDTITKCNLTIDYLLPQVENLAHNIISDTLNWVLIRGQFIATGTEKYAMIGNFKSDANTNTLLVNSANLPANASSYLIDDVSLIESNLPAFAGHDTSIFAGDSVYLGRESDVGIDEACVWYKLTSPTTSITVDTIAGFWIKPNVTSKYIVRQEICGLVKWDTVTIYMNAVGIEKLKILNEELKVYPVPAKDHIELSIFNPELLNEFHSLSIFNNLGLLISEEEIKFENKSLQIKTEDFPNGVYSLQLKNNSNEIVSKRFVISR